MRYEKPMLMDINARPVSGQDPLSCFDGNDPGTQGGYDICDVGTAAENYFWPTCVEGHGAVPAPGEPTTLCNTGGAANYCDAGGGGYLYPDNCTAGPSNV